MTRCRVRVAAESNHARRREAADMVVRLNDYLESSAVIGDMPDARDS